VEVDQGSLGLGVSIVVGCHRHCAALSVGMQKPSIRTCALELEPGDGIFQDEIEIRTVENIMSMLCHFNVQGRHWRSRDERSKHFSPASWKHQCPLCRLLMSNHPWPITPQSEVESTQAGSARALPRAVSSDVQRASQGGRDLTGRPPVHAAGQPPPSRICLARAATSGGCHATTHPTRRP
jgi:hypothetical protein